MIVSIFNDVVGPVMRGASSSHCAAALRIGRLVRDLMDGKIDRVLVEFDTGGALPSTHQSQGSDMGLFGGLLGWDADDDRLPDSARWLEESGVELSFEYLDLADPHPNTYRLTLYHDQLKHHIIAISTGGGMIEVIEIDGVKVSIGGDYDETLVWLEPKAQVDADSIAKQLGVDEVELLQGEPHSLLQIRAQRPVSETELARVVSIEDTGSVQRLKAVLPVRSRRDIAVPFQAAPRCWPVTATKTHRCGSWRLSTKRLAVV